MNKHLYTCAVLSLGISSLSWVHLKLQSTPPATQLSAAPSALRDKAEGLIKLDVLVTDATGNPVSGLHQSDLSLLENGRPHKLISFQAFDGHQSPVEPPVKIILLIDSLEMPERLVHIERLAVINYLRKLGNPLRQPVSVFELVETGLWTVTSSDDGNSLAHEIEHNQFTLVRHNVGWQSGPVPLQSKNSPQLSALKALAEIATEERKRPGRKLLLWVGPGSGMGSGVDTEDAPGSPAPFDTVWWFSGLLREARLVLSSFAVAETDPHPMLYKNYLDAAPSPQKASFMNLSRKVLAVQSGGRVLENSNDLPQQIESCARDAGPFYRISFDPFSADHPNEYHQLKVEVNRSGLLAHTNTGYYDQPYYSTDPLPPPRHVSIAQLASLLNSSRGGSDTDLAKQLSGLELTERLSPRKLSSLNAGALGKHSQLELRILADSSTFLDPPVDEIPTNPPPDPSAQRHILSLTSAYLNSTIHKLPDLFAKQTTVRFQETPMYLEAGTSIGYQPLHVTDRTTTTVHYRNGFEVLETKPPKHKPNAPELITYGVFGPALQGVLDTISRNADITWRRWEQGSGSRAAIFRLSVPLNKSDRLVSFCCLPDGEGNEAFQRFAAYHEEIAIDPESGAILRLEFHADLQSTTPLTRSDIMIEFGPVEIAGKTYICPLRSVSIVRARSVRGLTNWNESFRAYGPYATLLNDISFDRYHIFRSDAQMLTDLPEAK